MCSARCYVQGTDRRAQCLHGHLWEEEKEMDTTWYEEPTKEASPESWEKKNFLEGMALGLSLKGLGEASQAMENATERERAAHEKA